MKNKKLLLALLAVIMVLCVSIGPALAYFTTYTTVKGSKPLAVVPKTKIGEGTVNSTKKEVVVENTGDAPCFVRVKAFAREGVALSLQSGANWTGGTYDSASGCWVFTYNKMLMPQMNSIEANDWKTTLLTIGIDLKALPNDVEGFNIQVVYESTTAFYNDENGNPIPKWSQDVFDPAKSVQTGGTGA